MLEIDADKRITAELALAHPYLAQYADPTDEPVSLPYDQTFEDYDLPVEKWKGMIFDQTLKNQVKIRCEKMGQKWVKMK